MLKSYKIYTTCTNGALGLHLSRAPWDPYPWVSSIQKDSSSYQAGLRIGDCLLELNGQDVLGMKISEIAGLLKNHWLNESSNHVNVVIWRNKCNNNNNNNNRNTKNANDNCNKNKIKNDNDQLHDVDRDEDDDDDDENDDDDDEDEENNAHNINQQSLQKFATCLQHIAQLLECPVCLEVIKPPGWQCCNGHVLCNNCRSRSEKCPVCRVPLGPRGRCLLSDKLFTLLADSFPCDGVRSNKNSPKDRRKCSPEFHNQPKMAIVEKQQQQQQHQQQQQQQQQQDKEEQASKKAKDFILTSLRQRRRRKLSSTKANNDEQPLNGGQRKQQELVMVQQDKENSHSLRQKQAIYENSVDVNNVASNRKSSADYNHREGAMEQQQQQPGVNVTTALTAMTSAIQQCHCATCFKPDKVAIVNNNNSAGAVVLHIKHSHSQCATTLAPPPPPHNNEEKFQNFQCPTGKLCCLMMKNKNMNGNLDVNVMLPSTTTTTTTTATNNNLSSALVPAIKVNQLQQQQQQQQLDQVNKISKRLNTEWDILAHLTVDHQLPVQQYYAEYGQRIHVQNLIRSQTLVCLNLKSLESFDTKLEKFFIACIPLNMYTNKVAIFVYHMNCATTTPTVNTNSSLSYSALNDGEVSNFETIIENPLTGIKWFGRAHPLTTPWSVIKEKQHFLEHQVHHQQQGLMTSAVSVHNNNSGGVGRAAESEASDAFVFVVKRK